MKNAQHPVEAEFFAAVKARDAAGVADFLTRQPALVRAFDPDYFGAPPLNIAVSKGDLEMIDVLVGAGADPDLKGDWWAGGFAALHSIAPEERSRIAPRLIAAGATIDAHAAAYLGDLDTLRKRVGEDASVVHERGGDGRMPLHFASTPEVVHFLLEAGSDPEALDVDHESTPVMWAVRAFPDVARALLAAGARGDVFAYAALGEVRALSAHLDSHPDAWSWVIDEKRYPTSREDVTVIYGFTLGWKATPIHVAARCNQPDAIRVFAERGGDLAVRGDYDDATPLHIAAWEGSADAALALVHSGAPFDVPSGAQHENEPLGWAIVSGKVDLVKVLLAHGAEVKEHHRRQASDGEAGAFREWSRSTLDDWRRIREIIT